MKSPRDQLILRTEEPELVPLLRQTVGTADVLQLRSTSLVALHHAVPDLFAPTAQHSPRRAELPYSFR